MNQQENWMSPVSWGIVGWGTTWSEFSWKYRHVTQTHLGNHSKEDNLCLFWLLCHSRKTHKLLWGQQILGGLYYFPQPQQTYLIDHWTLPGWTVIVFLTVTRHSATSSQSISQPGIRQTKNKPLQSSSSPCILPGTCWKLNKCLFRKWLLNSLQMEEYNSCEYRLVPNCQGSNPSSALTNFVISAKLLNLFLSFLICKMWGYIINVRN